VNYNPTQNPSKDDLEIYLYIKGVEVGTVIETGIKIPVTVTHQISTTTTSNNPNGHSFPLISTDPEIVNAIAYLSSQQGTDGGIGGFSTSCWATMAITASGDDPHDLKKDGISIVEYLISNRNQIDHNTVTDLVKFILALTAANENPRNVDGTDYISLLESRIINNQFGDESMYNDDFWAILALVSAGVPSSSSIIQDSANFIKNHQNDDGGWSWHSGSSDVDNTTAAIMALIAAGENQQSSTITNALNYLKSQLHTNGGFTFMGDVNSASNSWAIMALVVCGLNPIDLDWKRDEVSPVDILLNLQNDDGSFSWQESEEGSAWWTTYAIPALLGKSYPITGESVNEIDHVYVRVEDLTSTVWRGWVEIPESTQIECYNSGNTYNIDGDNVLALLEKASEVGGFTYQVSDQWYPDLGFYVDSVGGHNAEGEYGWMYLVNYSPGNVSIDNYGINHSDHILIYWGTSDMKPLKIEVDHIEVDIAEPFTATVKYKNDSSGEWLPLPNATLYVNDDYTTDVDGKAIITLHEKQVYKIYAEKWGDSSENQFIRSDIVQVGVGVPIPEFSYTLTLTTIIILAAFSILHLKSNRNKCLRCR
jgi:hypothetical protein